MLDTGRDARIQRTVHHIAMAMGRKACAIAIFYSRGFTPVVKLAKNTLFCKGVTLAVAALLVPLSVFFASLTIPSTPAQAATSNQLNFQGRLLTNTGGLVPDGNYHIEFKLYNDTTSAGTPDQGACTYGGGTPDPECLWRETRTTGDLVAISNGYFSVYLGDVTALPNIDWSQDLYLGMNIGGSGGGAAWDGEMTPRFKLTAVPYAFKASNVASSSTNAASTNSDAVSITTGNAAGATSNSGNITIDTGTATGTTGTISLGVTNASGIMIGRNGLTTTVAGTLSVTGTTTIGDAITDGLTISAAIQGTSALIFDGSSDDTNELTLSVTDPSADRTVTLQDNSGVLPLGTAGNTLFFTTTGATSVTLPTSGTLCSTSTCLTAEADTLATVTGRGATTATASSFTGGATIRGATVDTATATDDRLVLSVTAGGAGRFDGTITNADLSAARTYTLPDLSGTFALTSNNQTFSNTQTFSGTLSVTGTTTIGDAITDGLTISAAIQGTSALIFDGSSDDTNELTLSVTDPSADRTVTLQDNSGVLPLGTAGNTLFFTTTGATSVTLPTSGTLCSTSTCLTANLSGFTDGGTLVALTTSTDDVTIGSTTPLAKFAIDGDSDEIQFLIQGGATQTSNLLVAEDSAGTDLFVVSGTGGVVASSTVSAAGSVLDANSLTFNAGSSVLQSASNSNLNISAQGSGTLTLTSGSGTAVLAASTLQRSGTALTIDVNSGSAATLTVDNVGAGNITLHIGDGTNYFKFDASSGPTYAGSARPTVSVILTPEYEGATLTPDGTNNLGTLTSDYCSGASTGFTFNPSSVCGASDEVSFYSWTSEESTQQDYDVWVRKVLPGNFDNFTSSTTMTFKAYRGNSSDSVTVTTYRKNSSSGAMSICGSATSLSTTSSWTTVTIDGDETACSFAAGDLIVFRITVSAQSSRFVRVSDINFSYRAKY